MFKSYRKESRIDWGVNTDNPLTVEQINCGSMLRIADATEAMAKNYVALQDEAARYKRWYEDERRESASLRRRNITLRGQITKLRNKLKLGQP